MSLKSVRRSTTEIHRGPKRVGLKYYTSIGNRMTTYLMKVCIDHHDLEALKGDFESTSAIYNITPDFLPQAHRLEYVCQWCSGTLHVFTFYDFGKGVLEGQYFCQRLVQLRSSHAYPSTECLESIAWHRIGAYPSYHILATYFWQSTPYLSDIMFSVGLHAFDLSQLMSSKADLAFPP